MGMLILMAILAIVAFVALFVRRSAGKATDTAELALAEVDEYERVRSSHNTSIKNAKEVRRIASVVAAVSAGVLVLTAIYSTMYTQDPGEAVVLKSVSGKVTGVDTTAGLGLKAPWSSKVSFDIRNQRIEMYTNEGGTGPDGAKVDLGLKGGATADTSVVVRYSIKSESVEGIYNEFKSEGNLLERELRPATRDATRDAAAVYEPFTIKEKRGQLATDIEVMLKERWEKYGIVVEGVDLGNIILDPDTEKAISGVNVSRQDVETARNKLNAARITAETTKVEAKAEADADQIIRCGATIEQATEEVAGEDVVSTQVIPKSGDECEERLNEQVLTSKYLDTLKEMGVNGNTIVVIPNDPAGGTNGPIINLPQPSGNGG